MLWPDGIHWNWDGSCKLFDFSRPPGLWWENGKVIRRDKGPAKVLVYSPWTGKGCIAVVGDSGPAPWTGRQAGVSNKVFDALGLPESHTRRVDGKTFSRGNPNPGHAPNKYTNPGDYPVIKYEDNPYWVKFFWADPSLPPGYWPAGSGETGGYLGFLEWNPKYGGWHLGQDFKRDTGLPGICNRGWRGYRKQD